MYFFRAWNIRLDARDEEPRLSHQISDGPGSSGTPSSLSKDLSHIIYVVAEDKAVYSDSMELRATPSCLNVCHLDYLSSQRQHKR